MCAPLIAAVLLLTLPFGDVASTQQPAKAPTGEQLEQELDAAATRLLRLLEKGEPGGFAALCSADGVLFGAARESTPLEDLRAAFAKKQGAYCLLFSTECLRASRAATTRPADLPLFSLRDRLLKASKREADLEVNRVEGTWVGDVFLRLEGAPGVATGRQPIEFSFGYEEGRWRLIAITLP